MAHARQSGFESRKIVLAICHPVFHGLVEPSNDLNEDRELKRATEPSTRVPEEAWYAVETTKKVNAALSAVVEVETERMQFREKMAN